MRPCAEFLAALTLGVALAAPAVRAEGVPKLDERRAIADSQAVIGSTPPDFTLLDRYRYVDEPALPVPITAFVGQQDPVEDPSDVRAWSEHGAPFELRSIPGGHFFLREGRDLLTDAVGGVLRRHVAP